MKRFFLVLEQSNEEDSGWKQIAKFGSFEKAEQYCSRLKKEQPARFSPPDPEYLAIEQDNEETRIL